MNQFDQPIDHRMTEEEAQAVLRILAERQREREGIQARPSVQDVAAMANMPVEEVQTALAQIRARFVPNEEVKRTRGPYLVPSLLVAGVALMLTIFLIGSLMSQRAPEVIELAPMETPYPPSPAPLGPPEHVASGSPSADSSLAPSVQVNTPPPSSAGR